jgi:Protein of unknown function (DUF1439)
LKILEKSLHQRLGADLVSEKENLFKNNFKVNNCRRSLQVYLAGLIVPIVKPFRLLTRSRASKALESYMKRRTLLVTVGVVGAAIVGGLAFLSTLTYEIAIPQSKIQEEIDKKFPIEKSAFIINIKLDQPKVILEEGSERVRFSVNLNVSGMMSDDSQGKAQVSGKIRYDRGTGQFFFSDAKIDKIDMEGGAGGLIEKFDGMLSDAMRDFLENQPLYTLDTEDFRQAIFKATLKEVVIRKESIVLRMGVL